MPDNQPAQDNRAALESQISSDVRALNAESDQISRVFATLNDLSANDFRALLHVMVADAAGAPLTSGALGKRLQVSVRRYPPNRPRSNARKSITGGDSLGVSFGTTGMSSVPSATTIGRRSVSAISTSTTPPTALQAKFPHSGTTSRR